MLSKIKYLVSLQFVIKEPVAIFVKATNPVKSTLRHQRNHEPLPCLLNVGLYSDSYVARLNCKVQINFQSISKVGSIVHVYQHHRNVLSCNMIITCFIFALFISLK